MVRKYDFPILWTKRLRQLGDFFDCRVEPPRLLDQNELNEKYSLKLDFLRYHQLKTCINQGAKNLNYKIFHPNLSDTHEPKLPLLFKIAIAQPKGCNFFYQTLRSDQNSVRNTEKSENKWHENLGATFSVPFWDKIFQLPKKMLVPNKAIWLQIQLNKHLLTTNYTVSHYDAKVSAACSFCSAHFEKLHFLFWGCGVVEEFWLMIGNLISNFYPNFILGRKEALFGDAKSGGDSVINTILMLARYFIWRQKFSLKTLDEVDFINYTAGQLQIIYDCQKIKNKSKEFLIHWGKIMVHFQVHI